MATFKVCVFEHQQREDKKYPVSIRLSCNRQSTYISTGLYAVRGQISRDFKTVKDTELLRSVDRTIEKYERLIVEKLGVEVKNYSAKELRAFLEQSDQEAKGVDFIAFSRGYIDKLLKKEQPAYGKAVESAVNALVDFFGRERVSIKEITFKSLSAFVSFLQSERTIRRTDQFGRPTTTERKAVSDRTVADYMSKIRTLFNAAIDQYNDEDMGVSVITHYPFRKMKIKGSFVSKKRNLSAEVVRTIRDAKVPEGQHRAELARDVFMLSFYLVGTNVVDLYYAEECSDGRFSYNRRKTSTRRDDQAFISIRIEPEAQPLFEKYKDLSGKRVFSFSKMYGSHLNFLRAVNAGLKQLRELTGIKEEVTSYYARHTWATLARNECGVALEDINLALNHVDKDMKVTDIYIARDFSLIDRANRKVIDCVAKSWQEQDQ